MIEVKEYKGKIYMIEANPRIWGPSQLINDGKMNLLYKFALDYKLLKSKKDITFEYKINVKYFWLGGIFEDKRKNHITVFHNYSKEDLEKEYEDWKKNDVYMREDTIELYYKEQN